MWPAYPERWRRDDAWWIGARVHCHDGRVGDHERQDDAELSNLGEGVTGADEVGQAVCLTSALVAPRVPCLRITASICHGCFAGTIFICHGHDELY